MSEVFDAYAAYYDLLYEGKDYAGEVRWVDALISNYCPGAHAILELGCGTGAHALELANRGYAVTGVDLSAAMVEQAKARAAAAACKDVSLDFHAGDLRTFHCNRSFDVVLALFHVMSYQTSNADQAAAMATAVAHLKPGGVFIFDCWYGPGVLSDPPAVRVRRLQRDDVLVTRIAEPEHYPNENRVDVSYEVIVQHAGSLERIRECHKMRYLFAPEVDLLLAAAGLRRLALSQWLDRASPDAQSWTACFVAGR